MFVLSFAKMTAQDSVAISILTCTPGEDVYSKFGHTALRVVDYTSGEDVVFNYGCFNYNADNFVIKFLLGQTDYMLEAEPMQHFMYRYNIMGVGVTEQVLNLNQSETVNLVQKLLVNLQPENQEYRYNWLFDNCTERARDMIENVIEGKVVYKKADEERTVRSILRECLVEVPWVSFGIDMLLGSEIDKPAERRVKMFIPDIYHAEADETIIKNIAKNTDKSDVLVNKEVEIADDKGTDSADNGEEIRPFIGSKYELLSVRHAEDNASMLSPMVVFCCLLLIVLYFSITDYQRKKQSVWLDVTLSIAQGLSGCIIAFLFFLSEHPAVDSNWLVIIFNPLPLLYAAWTIYCHVKQKNNIFAVVNLAVLTAFLPTMALCPQSFDAAMYVVVLTLMVRSVIPVIIKR